MEPVKTSLWLVRHGATELAAKGRCYGTTDIGLSDAGLKQAYALAGSLATQQFDRIYTSPLRRCADTARIIAGRQSCDVEIVEDLKEISFGMFEGQLYEDIADRYPDEFRRWMSDPAEMVFPGGESFSDFAGRVLRATEAMLACHGGGSVALVSHGGSIRVILADALGLPAKNLFRLAQGNAATSLIEYHDGLPTVEFMNKGASV